MAHATRTRKSNIKLKIQWIQSIGITKTMDGSKRPKDAMSLLMGRKPPKQIVQVEQITDAKSSKSNVNISQLLTGYSKKDIIIEENIPNEEEFDPKLFKEVISIPAEPKRLNSPAVLLSNDGKFNSNPAQQRMLVKLKVPALEEVIAPKTYKVSFKIDKYKLKEIITPKPKIKANKSTHPFFQAITSKLQNANTNKIKVEEREVRKSLLLKEPTLDRSQFIYKSISPTDSHMLDHMYNNHRNDDITLSIKKEQYKISDVYQFNVKEFMKFYRFNLEKTIRAMVKPIEYKSIPFDGDFNSLRAERYKNLHDKRFKRLTDSVFSNENANLWCDLYKPLKSNHILQTPSVTKDLHKWIEEAFTKLTKVDRNERIKMLKGKKKKSNPLDDFIILDDISFNDEIGFVPSLIIEGPIGSGKTSAVHAIITEHHGGHVFELNSSQSRAKKDIEFHLKQIGTTSMISTIENSVILFDDVELIDEDETDKDFWQGVLELLTYSYRPIIFTTNDISSIPMNIVKESTVCKFNNQSPKTKMEYIDLIAMNQNIQLQPNVLKSLSKFDLRRSIMELQMIRNHVDNLHPITISTIEEKPKSLNLSSKLTFTALEEHSMKIDLASLNDIPTIFNTTTYRRNFENCVEFYSSKLVNNRNRMRFDGSRYEEYINKQINSLFLRLPRSQVATDILPLIKSMAVGECKKLKNREEFDKQYKENTAAYLESELPIIPERKFGYDPNDIFPDL